MTFRTVSACLTQALRLSATVMHWMRERAKPCSATQQLRAHCNGGSVGLNAADSSCAPPTRVPSSISSATPEGQPEYGAYELFAASRASFRLELASGVSSTNASFLSCVAGKRSDPDARLSALLKSDPEKQCGSRSLAETASLQLRPGRTRTPES